MSSARGMVVVGAGECGARAALTLREAGWSGPIVLIGAEREAPYERPPLSKRALVSPEPQPPASSCGAEALDSAGITFIAGVAAVGLDRGSHEVLLADGRRIGYERLLLATGASARGAGRRRRRGGAAPREGRRRPTVRDRGRRPRGRRRDTAAPIHR